MMYPKKFFDSREFKEVEPKLQRASDEYSFYEVFTKITASELSTEMDNLINKVGGLIKINYTPSIKLNHNQLKWLDLFNGMMDNHKKFELDHSQWRQVGRTVFLVALAKLLKKRGLEVVMLVRNANEVRRLMIDCGLRATHHDDIRGSYGDIDVVAYDGSYGRLSNYDVILIDDWEYFECKNSSGLKSNNSKPQVIFSLSCNKFRDTLSHITG